MTFYFPLGLVIISALVILYLAFVIVRAFYVAAKDKNGNGHIDPEEK